MVEYCCFAGPAVAVVVVVAAAAAADFVAAPGTAVPAKSQAWGAIFSEEGGRIS